MSCKSRFIVTHHNMVGVLNIVTVLFEEALAFVCPMFRSIFLLCFLFFFLKLLSG